MDMYIYQRFLYHYFFYLSILNSMCVSMSIVGILIFHFGATSLFWVMLAYGLGGVSIGSFESNLLACITPLGMT